MIGERIGKGCNRIGHYVVRCGVSSSNDRCGQAKKHLPEFDALPLRQKVDRIPSAAFDGR